MLSGELITLSGMDVISQSEDTITMGLFVSLGRPTSDVPQSLFSSSVAHDFRFDQVAIDQALGVQFNRDASLTPCSVAPGHQFLTSFPLCSLLKAASLRATPLFLSSRTTLGPGRENTTSSGSRCILILKRPSKPESMSGLSHIKTTLGAILLGCVVSAAYVFWNSRLLLSLLTGFASQTIGDDHRADIPLFPLIPEGSSAD